MSEECFFVLHCRMRRCVLIFVMLVAGFSLRAQDPAVDAAILHLTGAADMEELDESETERFAPFTARPLRINEASRTELLSSSLLTAYQVASVLDYRSRHGDILSVAELSLVDGFSEADARALGCFVSFDTPRCPGDTGAGGKTWGASVVSRYKPGSEDAFKLKCKGEYGGRFSVGFTLQDNFYATFSSRSGRHNLLVGDYRLRFGQGLLFWDGFSLSGYSTLSAFSRRPTGAVPAVSFSSDGIRRGVVYSWSYSTVFVSKEDAGAATGGVHGSLPFRRGEVGLTAFMKTRGTNGARGDAGLSVDVQYNIIGMAVSAEAGYRPLDTAVVAAASLRTPSLWRFTGALAARAPGDRHEYAAMAVYASEKRVSLRGREGFGSSVKALEADVSVAWIDRPDKDRRQLKLIADAAWQISPSLSLKSRYIRTLRNYGDIRRDELRLDCIWSDGAWMLSSRLHAASSARLGIMGYLEAGRAGQKLSMYLRATAFRVDDWADRIYAWERDAPGNFSVPVSYGRGYRLSATGGYKTQLWRTRLRAYVKGSIVRYPWMAEQKEGKAELKFTFCWEY